MFERQGNFSNGWKALVLAPLLLASACAEPSSGSESVAIVEVTARIGGTLWTPWAGVVDFVPSEEVAVTYDENDDGTAEWSGTVTASSSGYTSVNLSPHSVKPGSRITATSATYTREMVVKDVRIEYANSMTNVVAGYAPPSSEVTVEVTQSGPPLAQVTVTADSEGRWSYDFSALYDIEDGREIAANVLDEQGNSSRVWWDAVVPSVGAGYSQYGANSVAVRNFAPGTTVRLRIDYANNGGPLDGYDYDQSAMVDNRYGFGFDLGGFDLLNPGDRLVATGGGWQKELITSPLRIEKADAATDVVGGMAEPSASVVARVMPPGGGGPAAAQLTVTADAVSGWWEADFSSVIDFDQNRQVMASILDEDGDETMTTWVALTPYFSALVTDGPPSGVSVWGFAHDTSVRVRVDIANDGSYDYDLTETVSQMFGHRFDLGGSGLLGAGDRVLVEGGGWVKEGVLALLSVSRVAHESDLVTGTAAPGAEVEVSVSVPPGDPGGPPIATITVTADSVGNWTADFSGTVDIVVDQQVNATIEDIDGDRTEAVGWAREDVWPKSGFEKPVANPPDYSTRKAGSVVPIKFSLGGDRGMDIFADGFPVSAEIPCDTSPEMEMGDPISMPGRNGLTYNATTQMYELRWVTSKTWKSTCRQLVVAFADGTSLRANFRFVR